MSKALQNALQCEIAALTAIQQRGMVKRAATVIGVDVATRTVELAFSSEAEVERWFGVEILSHAPGAVDMSRLQDGAALLWNHKWDDQRGVVESARIDADNKGRAVVRLSKNPAGEELLTDIADGIKRHVSVGYIINAIKLTEERDGLDVYTVTSWQPYEISFVSVPADTSVGVGRSANIPAIEQAPPAEDTAATPPVRSHTQTEENKPYMNVKTLRDGSGNLVRAKVNDEGAIVEVLEVIERAGEDVNSARRSGGDAERQRVRELTDLANQYGANVEGAETMLRDALSNGSSATAFQRELLVKLNERASKPLTEQLQSGNVGLSDNDQRQYSIMRVVRALSDPTDKRAQREAAFEFEVSEAARSKSGKDSEHFFVPTDVLTRSVYDVHGKRAMSSGKSGGADTGGYGIATNLYASSYIEVLRNRSTFLSLSRILGGLVGNVDIPKQISASQSFWLGQEDDDLGETGLSLADIVLSPKTIGAYSEITRKLLVQSSLDIEALVRHDLAIAAALGIDLAGYYGTGKNGQPLGLANVSGVNATPFATAGKPTFAELVDMETQIASQNADVEGMAYVANAKFRGYAKTAQKFPGTPTGATVWEPGNTVNGYRTEITNQIADGDVFHGNFNDVIVGMWGGLELMVDPYSNSKKGRIRITSFQDVDFAVRRTQSFTLGRKPA